MPLIKRGSFDLFTVHGNAASEAASVSELDTVATIREATRRVQPLPLKFPTSKDTRGLGLKSLRLKQGFEGFLAGCIQQDE